MTRTPCCTQVCSTARQYRSPSPGAQPTPEFPRPEAAWRTSLCALIRESRPCAPAPALLPCLAFFLSFVAIVSSCAHSVVVSVW